MRASTLPPTRPPSPRLRLLPGNLTLRRPKVHYMLDEAGSRLGPLEGPRLTLDNLTHRLVQVDPQLVPQGVQGKARVRVLLGYRLAGVTFEDRPGQLA